LIDLGSTILSIFDSKFNILRDERKPIDAGRVLNLLPLKFNSSKLERASIQSGRDVKLFQLKLSFLREVKLLFFSN
jgi:hypothetical protein